MNDISWIQKSLYSAVVFFGTLVALSLVYATTTYYSDLPNVNTGSGLSSQGWNNLVNYANKAIKQDTEVLTVTGGKVGIGITNPNTKLDVAGDIKATGGGTIGVTKINGIWWSSATNIPNNSWTYVGDYITLTPGNWIVYYNNFYDNDGSNQFAFSTYNHPSLSSSTNISGIVWQGNLGVCSLIFCSINQTYEVNVSSTATYYILHLINNYVSSVKIRWAGYGNFYAIKVN